MPRKPTHLNRLLDSILDASAQLGRARTEEERDIYKQKIQDLRRQHQEHLTESGWRQKAARRKKMDGWR
jgi:hypothetical protein